MDSVGRSAKSVDGWMRFGSRSLRSVDCEFGDGGGERKARARGERSTTTRSKLEASAGETPDLLTLKTKSLARKAQWTRWEGLPQVPGREGMCSGMTWSFREAKRPGKKER